jgi:hypothetical protein
MLEPTIDQTTLPQLFSKHQKAVFIIVELE